MEENLQTLNAGQIQQQDEEDDIDFAEIFWALLHSWKLLLITVVLGTALMTVYHSCFVKRIYEATTVMYITNTDSVISFQDLQIGSALTEDYKTIITSRAVLNKVISDLQLNLEYEELEKLITVSNPSGTHIINTSIKTTDASASQSIANDLLLVSVEQIYQIIGTGRPTVIDYAEMKGVKEVTPSLLKFMVIGGLIGFLLTAAFTTVRVLMDNTIKNDDDVMKYLHMPVLASVPYYEE